MYPLYALHYIASMSGLRLSSHVGPWPRHCSSVIVAMEPECSQLCRISATKVIQSCWMQHWECCFIHGISQLHQNPRPLPNPSTHYSKVETMKLLQVDCCVIALMSFEISILLLRNVHTLHSTYACCALIHPFPLLPYSPTATRMLIYVDYVMKILSLHTKSL